MKTESGLYCGIVPGELGEFLSEFFEQLPAFISAMVMSIDSTRAASGIASILIGCGINASLEGPVVFLTPEQLRRAVDRRMFTSFDEVWLLATDRVERVVPVVNLMPCDAESLRRLISATEKGMRDAKCVLALASGSDVGYATWDASFAELVEAHFHGREDSGETG